MQSCFIYCRVSTEEQADKGYSLDAQEKLCQDFARRNGYRVAGIYRDEGKSATNLDRAALRELLSRCGKENAVTAVIVQETDRLARNTKDHLTIKAILKKAGVKLISVAQPMLDDSPEGMMIDTILASVNQFQSDLNGRKTKRGMQEKFDQGWWPAWAPLGYINAAINGSTGDDRSLTKVIMKDPEKWDLLREGFQLYLTGSYSVAEINDFLYDKGLRSKYGRKMAHSTISQILKNPFYAGVMRWDNQERPGKHEPMITLREHKRLLQIVAAHNLHACRRHKHSFLLRGFIWCDICGQRYTAETHPAKKKDYYHCASLGRHSNRKQNVAVSFLEREIEKQFKNIQFSEEYANCIVEKLRTVYLEQRESINMQKRALYNKRKAIEVKREKAEEKLFDGVISDDDFVRIRRTFSDELERIQEQIAEFDYQHEWDIDTVQGILRMSRNIYGAYREATYEEKRFYLGLFWDRFVVRDRRIIRAVPTELIQSLQRSGKVISKSEWYPDPQFLRILEDHTYMAELKNKLSRIPGRRAKESPLLEAA